MLSNIGKKIQWLSLILAGVSLVTFLVFGIVFLVKASPDHVNEALRTAGIQAAIICFVSAVLTPCLMILPYGFGALIIAAERRTEDMHETKELLRQAIGEGLLADDIARGVGNTVADKLKSITITAPAAQPTNAPVQRPVTEPIASAPKEQKPAPRRTVAAEGGTAVRPLRPVGTDEEAF